MWIWDWFDLGAVSMEMNKKDILPLILTDEFFDDGIQISS